MPNQLIIHDIMYTVMSSFPFSFYTNVIQYGLWLKSLYACTAHTLDHFSPKATLTQFLRVVLSCTMLFHNVCHQSDIGYCNTNSASWCFCSDTIWCPKPLPNIIHVKLCILPTHVAIIDLGNLSPAGTS